MQTVFLLVMNRFHVHGPHFNVLWLLGCILLLGVGDDVVEANDSSEAYCFQYTWLGPTVTNESYVNETLCDDLNPQPPVCIDPLVYTADGSMPNTTAMWLDSEIRDQVNCRLAKNEVCAKWTYYYNGEVENTTHLCTKITIDEKYPMTSGCETQFTGGRLIEVCACRTVPSPSALPCNVASQNVIMLPTILVFSIIAATFVPNIHHRWLV